MGFELDVYTLQLLNEFRVSRLVACDGELSMCLCVCQLTTLQRENMRLLPCTY